MPLAPPATKRNPPPPPPPQRWGGDVLVSPTNLDCDRWLTLTMLQFHPIVLAMTADGIWRIVCMRLCGEQIRVLTTLPPPPPTHTHTHSHKHSPPHRHQQDNAAELSRPVLHDIHMHTFSVVRRPVLHACYAYAYLFSRTVTCSTRHTYAYLFQPEAEVKEGVAGVCERCVRYSYPQVFTVQQQVQMSVCVHRHPDTTARSDSI